MGHKTGGHGSGLQDHGYGCYFDILSSIHLLNSDYDELLADPYYTLISRFAFRVSRFSFFVFRISAFVVLQLYCYISPSSHFSFPALLDFIFYLYNIVMQWM